MGLRINTNLQALTAHKNLTKTDAGLSQSLERLSSGLRINKAADDASGLAIADNLRAQHTGIGQAISNANDGVNIIQIADGALEESLNIVTTIRSKAIQAASDAQNLSSRKAIQADVNKLLEELQMIGETTAYNGLALLDGSFINKVFHVGAYKDETVAVNIGDARATKIGAMAYAKTDKPASAAVSSPFLRGGLVTGESLVNGDIRLNGVQIGSSQPQFSTANYGTSTTAWAKAAAINAKVNETGVAAKAQTELVVSVAASIATTTLNSTAINGAANAAQLVSVINFATNFKNAGITAEAIDGVHVRIIAADGRNLNLRGTGAGTNLAVNGMELSVQTMSQRGTLTLTNARAMVSGETYVQSSVINTGDFIINGVDIAAGGSLIVKKSDGDHSLVNAINNNKELQTMGVRAELYSVDGGITRRLRIISEKQPISISGNDPHRTTQIFQGTREGVMTTGVVIEGAATDSRQTEDNYLRKIGFAGSRFGSSELNGANNSGGNDVAVVSRAYLGGSTVTAEAISAGSLLVNGIQVASSLDQLATYGSAGTAWAKAAVINATINKSGVAAKATTELVISVGALTANASLNGTAIAGATNAAAMISIINGAVAFQSAGIRAEAIDTTHVRIVAEDGRNLVINGTGVTNIGFNSAMIAGGDTVTQRGMLLLSNARAMVNSEGYVNSTSINTGELLINGVDIARGGSLAVRKGDGDRTLVNAINNNEELQKMGIRAEQYVAAGDDPAASEYRIRIISERDPLVIGGTDPVKTAKLLSGTTEGTTNSQVKITGALVDTNPSTDNYLRRIGFGGTQFGSSEETGVNNAGGNDTIFFGVDRFSYKTGDISINGYKIGQPAEDTISTTMNDQSAEAWAAAINLVKVQTGVEADIIKAVQVGAGVVQAGTLQQRDLVINGIDIVRDNSGGKGMEIKDGDAGQILMKAINEYKDQTGVVASIDDKGSLVLSAVDGRNIHVQSTANGNKFIKFESDFGVGRGVAQDSVFMGNVRLVSDEKFEIDGAGSSAAAREMSLLRAGLAGGGSATDATSDLRGDGTLIAGINYKTAISTADVTTQEGAEMVIRSADYAIKRLDSIRSGLGSVQNQLTSTVANLSVTKINVQSTESTIRDVDFAQESSVFSKMQVLMQAGTYAQSQANASAQNVMRLLQ